MRFAALFIVASIFLSACNSGSESSDILNDISGVWRAQKDAAMITIASKDNKFTVLIGDDDIPGTVGDIDIEHETVNLNVMLNTGKLGVWTFRKVWDDKEKTSYHLALTTHDGTQDELSFVRKVSTDDLNRIANLTAKVSTGSISQSAAPSNYSSEAASTKADGYSETTASVETAPPAPVPTAPAEKAPQSQDMSFAPSFDCNKASTGPERLICSNKVLAEADVKMAQAYKSTFNGSADKSTLKQNQRNWMLQIRDACSNADCMIDAYNTRLTQLR